MQSWVVLLWVTVFSSIPPWDVCKAKFLQFIWGTKCICVFSDFQRMWLFGSFQLLIDLQSESCSISGDIIFFLCN